jgi:hypothetical protein
MSLSLFIPTINELSSLLVLSHASNGGTVLLSRNNKIWNNLSAKSIINAYRPEPHARIIQTSLLELCKSGDGCKLGSFITFSLLKSFYKEYGEVHPKITEQVRKDANKVIGSLVSIDSNQTILKEIGLQSELDEESIDQISEAIYLAGSLSSHVSLEKWEGTGCEVIETESFHASLKVHHDKEAYLKGTMFALFSRPVFEVDHVLNALEYMGSFEGRPLVIIAPMVGGKALQTIKMNNHKGTLEVYACDAPRVIWGKGWLDDLAAFTGASVVDQKLEKFKPEYYGSAISTVLNYNEIIIDPYDDHVESTSNRVDELLREAESCPYPHTQDQLRKRANALNGTLVRLKVGGSTEADARWRRVLAEKALISMMDAKVNGYVKGAIPTLYNIETGNEYLDRALKAPFKVVCHNLGVAENDSNVWSVKELYEPFPVGRLIELLDKSISIATTIGSVGHVIRSKQ